MCALDKRLRAFWEQEEIFEKRHFTEEEELYQNNRKSIFNRPLLVTILIVTVYLPFKADLN